MIEDETFDWNSPDAAMGADVHERTRGWQDADEAIRHKWKHTREEFESWAAACAGAPDFVDMSRIEALLRDAAKHAPSRAQHTANCAKTRYANGRLADIDHVCTCHEPTGGRVCHD